jgi:hypothetical protein
MQARPAGYRFLRRVLQSEPISIPAEKPVPVPLELVPLGLLPEEFIP